LESLTHPCHLLRPLQRRHPSHLPNVERSYLLDPIAIYERAIEDGTVIDEGQFTATVARYKSRLARHCGIKYDDIITIRNPKPHMPPVFCVVAATNLSKRSKIPRTDIIEKAKEFLGTTEEPKWYYIARV
jgi:hypothetical protein